MVHIKGYSFNIVNLSNEYEKKFYFLHKSPSFINLIIFSFIIDKNMLYIEFEDYYNNRKNIIYTTNIHQLINVMDCLNLIQIASDQQNISFCDGKIIYLVDVYKTIYATEIVLNKFSVHYLTTNISNILLINNLCIFLNVVGNFFILDSQKNTNLLKSFVYSHEIFIKMSKNNKFILIKNNDCYEIIDIFNQTKLKTFKESSSDEKMFLLSNSGKCHVIKGNKLIIYQKDSVKTYKIQIDKFAIGKYIANIDTCEHTPDYIDEDIISLFNPENNIYNLIFLAGDNLYIHQMNIPNSITKSIYINNNIFYYIHKDKIHVFNMNSYTNFGLLLTILEIYNKTMGSTFSDFINSCNLFDIHVKTLDDTKLNTTDISNLYNIKPIGINEKLSNLTMNDFIKNMVKNYNVVQTLVYELVLENTSDNFMNDIIDCLIEFKKNITNKIQVAHVSYIELLLILFLYCYHLELPNKKNNISILKSNENNRYKNNNISGYKYPKGYCEKIFANIQYNKKLFLESIESSLFY